MIRVAITLAAMVGAAHADERDVAAIRQTAALADGAFVPANVLAPLGERAGHVLVAGGYDDGAAFSSAAEMVLARRVALRAGFAGTDREQHVNASVQVALARGLHVAVGYDGMGHNTVPAMFARVGVAHGAGSIRTLASAAIQLGLAEDERAGELALAAYTPMSASTQLGWTAQGTLDLERDADEPEGEPDWQLRTGPYAAIAVHELVATASLGVATSKPRLVDHTRTSMIAMLGLGRAF